MNSSITLSVALLTAALSSPALAAYQHTASVGSNVIGSATTPSKTPRVYSYSNFSGAQTKQATVVFSNDPIAAVSIASHAYNPVGEISFSVGATKRYTFDIISRPLTYVPINFFGVYSAYQDGQGRVSATSLSADIFGTNPGVNPASSFSLIVPAGCGDPINCATFTTTGANTNYIFNPMSPGQTKFTGNFYGKIKLLTNETGFASAAIQLAASANLHAFPGFAEASAYIDPHIEIAPDFLATNATTTLSITPGIGNQTLAVPEPSAILLMAVGIGVLGSALRVRQSNIAGRERAAA